MIRALLRALRAAPSPPQHQPRHHTITSAWGALVVVCSCGEATVLRGRGAEREARLMGALGHRCEVRS